MGDELHLKIIMQAADVRNERRDENPAAKPDLNSSDLGGKILWSADFRGANLSNAKHCAPHLGAANFHAADLGDTNLLADLANVEDLTGLEEA